MAKCGGTKKGGKKGKGGRKQWVNKESTSQNGKVQSTSIK